MVIHRVCFEKLINERYYFMISQEMHFLISHATMYGCVCVRLFEMAVNFRTVAIRILMLNDLFLLLLNSFDWFRQNYNWSRLSLTV